MTRVRGLRRRWWAGILLGAVVSCGHDAPTRPDITPEALAHQLDSLATASEQAGHPEGSMALSQAALALRSGSASSDITISDGGTAAQYQALALRIDPGTAADVATPPGTTVFQLPTIWGLVAWQSDPAGRVILITGLADSVDMNTAALDQASSGTWPPENAAIGIGLIIEGGKLQLVAVSGNAVLTPTDSLGPCAQPTQRIYGATAPTAAGTTTLPPLTCTRSSFAGHFDIAFQPAASTFPFAPQAGAPTRALTMTRQTVNGIRLAPETTP